MLPRPFLNIGSKFVSKNFSILPIFYLPKTELQRIWAKTVIITIISCKFRNQQRQLARALIFRIWVQAITVR